MGKSKSIVMDQISKNGPVFILHGAKLIHKVIQQEKSVYSHKECTSNTRREGVYITSMVQM